jgi:hypothetical protein
MPPEFKLVRQLFELLVSERASCGNTVLLPKKAAKLKEQPLVHTLTP